MSQNQGLLRLWLSGTEVPNTHETLGSVIVSEKELFLKKIK